MRSMKVAAILAVIMLGMSMLSMAERNKFGVSDTQKVTFNEPIKVGDVLLPKGEYNVQHTMEGENHVMVFTQITRGTAASTRVKCQLVPLPEKAQQTQVLYGHDQKDGHVLQELIFRGDTAKHVF
jgi:hypothetical protein